MSVVVISRRESWVRAYARPSAMRIAVGQTACALALLAAAGVVAMVSADAIAQTVVAGAALVAAVALLSAVIVSMAHLAAQRALPRFPGYRVPGAARPPAAVLEEAERTARERRQTPPETR